MGLGGALHFYDTVTGCSMGNQMTLLHSLLPEIVDQWDNHIMHIQDSASKRYEAGTGKKPDWPDEIANQARDYQVLGSSQGLSST